MDEQREFHACKRISIHQADPTKRRISQNVSTSDHTRSVLKIRLNGYPFSVIGTSSHTFYQSKE